MRKHHFAQTPPALAVWSFNFNLVQTIGIVLRAAAPRAGAGVIARTRSKLKLHVTKASSVKLRVRLQRANFDISGSPLCNQMLIRGTAVLFISLLSFAPAQAELSQKQARKAIAKAAGLTLRSSAVHIERIVSSSAESAEVTTQLELVFRLARDEKGLWQIGELRTGEAQWEDVETIAQAAKLDLQQVQPSR